jgi:hypothetical protein
MIIMKRGRQIYCLRRVSVQHVSDGSQTVKEEEEEEGEQYSQGAHLPLRNMS